MYFCFSCFFFECLYRFYSCHKLFLIFFSKVHFHWVSSLCLPPASLPHCGLNDFQSIFTGLVFILVSFLHFFFFWSLCFVSTMSIILNNLLASGLHSVPLLYHTLYYVNMSSRFSLHLTAALFVWLLHIWRWTGRKKEGYEFKNMELFPGFENTFLKKKWRKKKNYSLNEAEYLSSISGRWVSKKSCWFLC